MPYNEDTRCKFAAGRRSASKEHMHRGMSGMKLIKICAIVLAFTSVAAWGSAIPSSARTAIPSDVQQIITVDYRTLKNSSTAMALKQQVLPPGLKEFEGSLKGIGIDPDKDVDQ